MHSFQIKIAGETVGIHSLFESTGYYCRNYTTAEEPAFWVTVTPEALEQEQRLLRQDALEEGLRPRVFPDPFLERSFIQRAIADELAARNILLFHGSAVALDGQGYLFTAPCGTGKSTHTRLWRQVFGDRAVMINDDKPFLLFRQEEILVCGAPWSGKHGLDTNISVPLRGLCILARGSENRVHPATPEQAQFLHSQRHHPENPETDRLCRELTEQLAQRIPLWYMTCTKDPEAARAAWEAMQ